MEQPDSPASKAFMAIVEKLKTYIQEKEKMKTSHPARLATNSLQNFTCLKFDNVSSVKRMAAFSECFSDFFGRFFACAVARSNEFEVKFL
jgi:hypothetical protein